MYAISTDNANKTLSMPLSPNTKDILHQHQGATDSLFDFYKQEIFTYPLSNNFHLNRLQNSNLSSRQSVVRCAFIYVLKFGKIMESKFHRTIKQGY